MTRIRSLLKSLFGITTGTVEAWPIRLPTSTGPVTGSMRGQYTGFTVRETAGATARVIIYDGIDATGPIIEEINLAANQSTSDHYPRPGRLVTTALYAAVTGAIEGSCFQ